MSGRPYDPGLPRYIRITDIDDQGRLSNDRVSPGGERDEWLAARLEFGDVLFARSGATVGKTYLHKSESEPCVFAGYLIRFRPDDQVLRSEYLFWFTKTVAYERWVARRQRAVAQPNINARQYGELMVPVPPLDLQREFETRVEAVGRLADSYRASASRVTSLFASLQDRAFAGEL